MPPCPNGRVLIEEVHISRSLQKRLADENNQLKVDDAAKTTGCRKGANENES
jgi:Leu/Phe-tRNA-protein transferase